MWFKSKQVPAPESSATWEEIKSYAKTYDGYKHFGSSDALANIANNLSDQLGQYSIDELRGVLFFEYRRFNHIGTEPDESSFEKIKNVVSVIKDKESEIKRNI